MLIRCLYASRPTAPPSAQMLDDILAQSRRNNPARGVTGLLCFTSDVFMQVLEGGRDQLCDLFEIILKDSRHHQVRILVYEEILERRYSNWAMGQANIEKINPSLLLRYFEQPEIDPFICSGKATMAFLDEMVATAAIVSRTV